MNLEELRVATRRAPFYGFLVSEVICVVVFASGWRYWAFVQWSPSELLWVVALAVAQLAGIVWLLRWPQSVSCRPEGLIVLQGILGKREFFVDQIVATRHGSDMLVFELRSSTVRVHMKKWAAVDVEDWVKSRKKASETGESLKPFPEAA